MPIYYEIYSESVSPLVSTETGVHYRRLDYMSHAYLAVVTAGVA